MMRTVQLLRFLKTLVLVVSLLMTANDQLTHSRRKMASAANRATELSVTVTAARAGGCWVERMVV